MTIDLAGPDDPAAVAVLLHPHPQFGGDRFHPLVGGLFASLPDDGVAAARFDMESADADAAHRQVLASIDAAVARWPDVPVVLVGYSFGAGVAAAVDDRRVAGWLLVAPQVGPLLASPIGRDERPTAILVPERDQYAPPARVREATEGWVATTLDVVPGDHFLGASLGLIVDRAREWVRTTVGDR